MQNEVVLLGAEDGTVWSYDAVSGKMGGLLVRCALPVRDIAVSRDGKWVAVASECVLAAFHKRKKFHQANDRDL